MKRLSGPLTASLVMMLLLTPAAAQDSAQPGQPAEDSTNQEPLIVWSHGFTGSAISCAYLCEHLAAAEPEPDGHDEE